VALHLEKGDLLLRLGDRAGARTAYDEAVRRGPAFPEARWARERLRAGDWLERPAGAPTDYVGAYARIRDEAKGIGADSPAPAIAEGFLRHREGEFETALRLLEPFAKTHAFDAEIVETVARAKAARAAFGQELAFRRRDEKKGDLPRVRFQTSEGAFVVELFEDDVPNAVADVVWLAAPPESGPGFFDGASVETRPFAEVVFGAPPGFAIPSERSRRTAFRGSVVLREEGADSAGGRLSALTGTTEVGEGEGIVVGRVVEGQDVVERLTAESRIESAAVLRRREHAYRPTTVAGEPAPAPRRR
jgi:cyclophilin family peptidyl-prolyl cis-trans isomerase